ncbi:unnamed protein product [Lepeophtheirus salmonis]|uniref:(salmon louse) hypothetical protein n=1 Tax=Lepeophtheirus salmonis TaxID=72036 RepID=A0A7R8HAQ0_LEPSM|nr:unnamed protein product [Lepeophtheirus salmonis]CAF2974386.1 unnamed protein product [Lepeophtheirus salmonis]
MLLNLFILLSLQISWVSPQNNFETCSAKQQEMILSRILSCRPIETVIPLDYPFNDTYSLMKPTHVSVKRCQGSCFSNNCIAKQIINRNVDVLYFPRSSNPDGTISPICSSVIVQDHITCGCGCSITADECTDTGMDIRVYLPGECRCACRDVSKRGNCLKQGNFWNFQTCECMCQNPNSWPICPTGYSFDFNVGACHCVPPAEVASILLEIALVLAFVSGIIILWAVFKYATQARATSRVRVRPNYIATFRNRLFSRMESEDDGEEREELKFFVWLPSVWNR